MRTPVLCLFAAGAIACGSGAPTGTASPGAPASVAIAAGDGQIAEPGIAVSVNPAALVLDAAGHPVPGVTVAFRVDSGGGTLASATATTGNNGVAAAGEWRLGVGSNVVIASVGTLPPVRFRAIGRFGLTRTLINGQVVAAGGGTLRYTQPGDPLSGLEIKVPAGAYPGSTTWTVSADSTVPVPLPADFSQVGPVLVIGNERGYADNLIALTVPMRISADDAVAPFFFDAASGTLEGVPLLARSDSNITFASRHFSGSLMAIPGSAPGPAGLRSAASVFNVFSAFSAVPAVGTIKMVFIRIPQSKLIGTFSSSFRPGQDDWEFPNLGDYQNSTGNCEGMTATEIYYHYFFRSAGAPALSGRFDHFPTNDWDNERGVHLVGAVQSDYVALLPLVKAQQDAIGAIAQNNGETPEALASTWILLNLKLTRRPLMVGVHGQGGHHAIVAYQATATAGTVVVGVANPNHPGVAQTLTFQGGNMVPQQFETIAGGQADVFTNATVFGVTSETPLTSFHSRWAEFLAGTPGEDRLPTRFFEVYDSVSATWGTLPETVRLVADTLLLRVRCPSCPHTFENSVAGADLIQMVLQDQPGTTLIQQGFFAHVAMSEGTRSFFVRANALTQASGSAFLDGRLFTVVKGKLRLFPQSLSGRPDTTYTFTLTHGGLAKPDSRFVWDFGDGTPPQTVIGDSLRTHVYTAIGNYTVTVELRDVSNHLVGRTTSVVAIGAGAKWRLTSFQQISLTNTFPDNHQPAAPAWEKATTTNELRDSILARPAGAILELLAPNSAHPQGFRRPDEYQYVYRAETPTDAPAIYLSYGRGVGLLAEAVAAVGSGTSPTLPAASYPFSFMNSYNKTGTGVISYSGTAANWVMRAQTLVSPACQGPAGMIGGSPYSLARSYLVFNATSTPTGLTGTIAFVTQFEMIEIQWWPTVCWWEPGAEVRRTFSFTATPTP